MQIASGYMSRFFVTDDRNQVAELTIHLFYSEETLFDTWSMLPLLEVVIQSRQPLFIVAGDVNGDLLPTLVKNKMAGSMQVAAIRAPEHGEARAAILDKVAQFTGAKVFSNVLGVKLENITLAWLGRAEKVVVAKDRTTIYGGFGKDVIDGPAVAITGGGAATRQAAATEFASDRTGAQGRPTSRHLVEAEFERRMTARETLGTLKAEAQALSDWLSVMHPHLAPMTRKTIENCIRTGYTSRPKH